MWLSVQECFFVIITSKYVLTLPLIHKCNVCVLYAWVFVFALERLYIILIKRGKSTMFLFSVDTNDVQKQTERSTLIHGP